MSDGIKRNIAFGVVLAVVLSIGPILVWKTATDQDRAKLADANRELLLAKQALEFKERCQPAMSQRSIIGWRQSGLFCIKQEWNGKRWVEVEVKRVSTIEGFLAYPLGRKE